MGGSISPESQRAREACEVHSELLASHRHTIPKLLIYLLSSRVAPSCWATARPFFYRSVISALLFFSLSCLLLFSLNCSLFFSPPLFAPLSLSPSLSLPLSANQALTAAFANPKFALHKLHIHTHFHYPSAVCREKRIHWIIVLIESKINQLMKRIQNMIRQNSFTSISLYWKWMAKWR